MSSLKRTKQCAKCPWKKSTDPLDIPGNYTIEQHKDLISCMATPSGSLEYLNKPMKVMSCHEHQSEEGVYCVGYLNNQLHEGNNIALRMRMLGVDNVSKLKVFGEQHATFEDTIPKKPVIKFSADDFQFVFYGIYYGYAPCCINNFLDRVNGRPNYKNGDVLSGSGLVLCKDHAQDFAEAYKKDRLAEAKENYFHKFKRLEPLKFPNTTHNYNYFSEYLGYDSIADADTIVKILKGMNDNYEYIIEE